MANSVTRQLLLAEVAKRGWQSQEIGDHAYLLRVTLPDGRTEIFRGSCPMRSSAVGLLLCKRKDITLDFVGAQGYQTAPYALAASLLSAEQFLAEHKRIVVKPADGARTEGVSVNITTDDMLHAAYQKAHDASPSKQVILQKHIDGRLYRLLVIHGKLVAASERSAASVVGDGNRSLDELVRQLNSDPRRGAGLDSPLKSIDIKAVTDYLGADAMSRIVPAGQRQQLSAIDSVSAGGEAVTVTGSVHDDWRHFCETISTEAGLFIAGYDVICDDIAAPLEGAYVPLLEINAAPGFKLHEYPTAGGDADHIAPLLLDALFPDH